MLRESDKELYARHLLLVEIGERGQEQLCAAQLAPVAGADRRAVSVAADYLRRGGSECGASAGNPAARPLSVLDPAAVDALAGSASLREAAAWLAGSFAAVEAIKQVVGVGRPGVLPAGFCLGSEVV